MLAEAGNKARHQPKRSTKAVEERDGIYQEQCLGRVGWSLQLHCTQPCSHDPFDDLLVLETKPQISRLGSRHGNGLQGISRGVREGASEEGSQVWPINGCVPNIGACSSAQVGLCFPCPTLPATSA